VKDNLIIEAAKIHNNTDMMRYINFVSDMRDEVYQKIRIKVDVHTHPGDY